MRKIILLAACFLFMGLSVPVNDPDSKTDSPGKSSLEVRVKRLEDEIELRRKQSKTKQIILPPTGKIYLGDNTYISGVGGNLIRLTVSNATMVDVTSSSTSFKGTIVSTESITDYGFYHDRGDPSAFDQTAGTLTTDATWNDWDMSSVVPSDAKAVSISVFTDTASVQASIFFRENGNTNAFNLQRVVHQVANIDGVATLIVACDSSQVIEYKASSITWTNLDITINGWWK